ncbi:hypothetical protein [Corynebacterium provencense]|uniref:hypothetical protein n=1 Tax=Corynebacterium provencense TaxID=1737425 RepID=UPI000836212E|nr:hypothetical protein [Corynebacterium provencense]
MSRDNAEQFAALVQQALTSPVLPDTPAPDTPDTDTGPRRPAPVPEAGRGGTAPGAREAEALHDFEQTVTRSLNINRL